MLFFFAAPALITIMALLVYFVQAFAVGKARGKYGIKAPAVTGNEAFERIYRVQMNTLEQLILFLPALWLFAVFSAAPLMASGLGAVWIVGRILYAQAYYVDASKRSAGFAISLIATTILLAGSLVGVVVQILRAVGVMA